MPQQSQSQQGEATEDGDSPGQLLGPPALQQQQQQVKAKVWPAPLTRGDTLCILFRDDMFRPFYRSSNSGTKTYRWVSW